MSRGSISNVSKKIKREIITNRENIVLLKTTLEKSIKRINENTLNADKNANNLSSIGNVLFNELINFKQKDEVITDMSNGRLLLTLIDTYPINMEYIDGIFKPTKTHDYLLTGSFEVNNTTKKHKLFELCLYDEDLNIDLFTIKQTLIGGFNTLPIYKCVKIVGDPYKKKGYSFRAKGDKIKLNNVDLNLLKINGTMA